MHALEPFTAAQWRGVRRVLSVVCGEAPCLRSSSMDIASPWVR
jgi:hypothetical protein